MSKNVTKNEDKIEVRCCILQYLPNIKRREFLNIGIVSFLEGSVDIILTSQRERVITSFPEVNIEEMASVVFEIKTLMNLSENYEECYSRLKNGDIPDFKVSPIAGFRINNDINEYKKVTGEILKLYVNTSSIKQSKDQKLNIYSPLSYNLDSFIVGSRSGLIALRGVIDKVLVNNSGASTVDIQSSDGELFACKVVLVEDDEMPVMEPMYKCESIEEKFGMLTPEELYLRKTRKHEQKWSDNSLEPK